MKTIQTSKDKLWYDESGIGIPYTRITKSEKLKERFVVKLYKEWTKLRDLGMKVKEMAAELCEKSYQEEMREKGVEPSDKKGSYTFYCFNRKIKVERSVHGNPTYDEATIEAAKIKFDQYLTENLTGSEDFIPEMITDAFESRSGQLDKTSINKLISYKNRSKNKVFIAACDLLSTAVRYPSKSIYYRMWEIDSNGKYKNIDVQFSSL